MRYLLLVLVLCMNVRVSAKEYHVSVQGKESGDGSVGNPFRHIQMAADIAQPGDMVTVHEGVYRERVNPPRGGESDSNRIVYRAAPGEKVEIRGSEVVTGWEKAQNDTWKVTLPNSFFGDFNPYSDIVSGEWYEQTQPGFDRHAGAVYLNGSWLDEAQTLDEVLSPVGRRRRMVRLKRGGEKSNPEPVADGPMWRAEVNKTHTVIWAQFKDVDPNEETVEINVRQAVFYPELPGRDYITVRGFIMRHAATPWSGQMSEQIGLIGTHWSKGWIIENNVISHSINTGLTLGCYNPAGIHPVPEITSPGYVEFIKLAEAKTEWTRDHVGSHVVRNNHISHCEKNGLHSSLGGPFSIIEGNTICDIAVRGWLGLDVSGLKLLGSQDCLIRNNHLYRCRGFAAIWLDWMAQGVRISGNLLHDNNRDLFMEISHGPNMVDNNLFLSSTGLLESAGGGAYVHNLFAGKVTFRKEMKRSAVYHKPHSLRILGVSKVVDDDERFHNNLFLGQPGGVAAATSQRKSSSYGLSSYRLEAVNLQASGNVYLAGAMPSTHDRNALVAADFEPGVKLEEKPDGWWFKMSVDPEWTSKQKRTIVTSEALGQATIPKARFEQPNGSPYKLDTDYFGKPRNAENPAPGPFRFSGDRPINVKVRADSIYIDGVAPGSVFRYGAFEYKWLSDENGNGLIDYEEVRVNREGRWQQLPDKRSFDQSIIHRRLHRYMQDAYVYKETPTRDLTLHIDFPEGWKKTDKRPAMLWFYGGGWGSGTVFHLKPQSVYFARRGVVGIRVDYRVTSRDGMRDRGYTATLDAKTALRWVHKNAASLGIDRDKIMAGGASAGGHVALATQIPSLNDPGDDTSVSTKLCALILQNPFVVRANDKSWVFLIDFKTLPAMWIAYGLDDEGSYLDKPGDRRLEKNGESLIKGAQQAGLPLKTYIKEGFGHGFCSRPPQLALSTWDVDQFLQKLGILEKGDAELPKMSFAKLLRDRMAEIHAGKLKPSEPKTLESVQRMDR